MPAAADPTRRHPRRHPRRRRRRIAVVAVAVPVSLLAVLLIEAMMARRGSALEQPPLDLDTPLGSVSPSAFDVVWLGDSTAAGVGASSAATALPTLVAAGPGRPVETMVLARSGATVSDVIERQLPAVASLEAEVVFVSVGANDVTHLTSRSDFERRYRLLVAALPEQAEVVLLGVPDMGAVPRLAQPLRAVAGFRGDQLDDVVESVAADTANTYVDIAGETGPTMRSDPERFFAGDGYHPSDAGYRLWADAVLDAVGRSAMLAP